jgi:hypothetical protein
LLYYLLLFLTKYVHCLASPPDIGTLAVREYILFLKTMYSVHIEKQKVYIPRTVKTIPRTGKEACDQFKVVKHTLILQLFI